MTGLNTNFGILKKKVFHKRKTEHVFLIIDMWPWNMDSPLSDDPNGEHYDFNALMNDQVKPMKKFLFQLKKNFFFFFVFLESINAC